MLFMAPSFIWYKVGSKSRTVRAMLSAAARGITLHYGRNAKQPTQTGVARYLIGRGNQTLAVRHNGSCSTTRFPQPLMRPLGVERRARNFRSKI